MTIEPPSRAAVAGRRGFLQGSLLAGAASVAGILPQRAGGAVAPTAFTVQLGWLPGVTQVGEIVAMRLGYYAEEGLALAIQPGGPSQDGVALVASGRADVGQAASSPSLLMAVAQGLPIRCFAVGAQRHPFCFFSLPRNPVRTPADLKGKRIGLNPASLVLLRALLARHGISDKEVTVIPTGVGTPLLMTGQADVITGWSTNTEILREVGRDTVQMTLWDAGVRLYGLPYYASTKVLQARRRELEAFLRATARGWRRAAARRDEAVELTVREYPRLDGGDLRLALDKMLGFSFGGLAQKAGWGAMDPAFWGEQIEQLAALGQLARRPAVAEVMTPELLDVTREARLRAG